MFELIETEGQLTKYIIKESLEDGNRFIKSDLIKHIEPLEKEVELEKKLLVSFLTQDFHKVVDLAFDKFSEHEGEQLDKAISKIICSLPRTENEKGALHAIRSSDNKLFDTYVNKILLDNISAIVNGCYYEGV